jgi:hypothetical protein
MIITCAKYLRLIAIGAAIISTTATLFATHGSSTVLASHTFEAGASNVPKIEQYLYYDTGNS